MLIPKKGFSLTFFFKNFFFLMFFKNLSLKKKMIFREIWIKKPWIDNQRGGAWARKRSTNNQRKGDSTTQSCVLIASKSGLLYNRTKPDPFSSPARIWIFGYCAKPLFNPKSQWINRKVNLSSRTGFWSMEP